MFSWLDASEKTRADTPLAFIPHLGVHLYVNLQAGQVYVCERVFISTKNAFVKISRVKKQSLRNYIEQLNN